MSIVHFFEQYPFLVTVLAFLLGFLFMPLVINIARKHDLVVKPNKRTSHQGAIPNIGGLDIFMVLLIIYVVFISYTFLDHYVLIGFCIIFLVGFIDDLIDLTPFIKLLGESIAAIFLIGFANIRITNLYGIFGIEELPLVLSYLISYIVFWAIVNALNLIDGVDGLASGLGILYSIFFSVYFYMIGEYSYALLAAGCIGALAVFFLYNVFGGSRRKIFMGDSGSLLLGYLLTLLTITFLENNLTFADSKYYMSAAPVVAICVMFVPIFDTVRVMLTRVKQGNKIFKPDRNHIHHLLLRAGLKHRQVTAVLLAVSLIFIALGIIGRSWNIWFLLFIAGFIATLLVIILWRILDYQSAQAKDI